MRRYFLLLASSWSFLLFICCTKIQETFVIPPTVEERVRIIGKEVVGKNLYITSTLRTPAEQAELMFRMIKMGFKMEKLYLDGDQIAAIRRAYKTDTKSPRVIEDTIAFYMSQGRFLSAHLCGRAVDIGFKGLTMGERQLLKDTIKADKYLDLLDETTHYHVQSKGGCKGGI